jgi:hypothetical protein
MLNKDICKKCINKNRKKWSFIKNEPEAWGWDLIDEKKWENNKLTCPCLKDGIRNNCIIFDINDKKIMRTCLYKLEHVLKNDNT